MRSFPPIISCPRQESKPQDLPAGQRYPRNALAWRILDSTQAARLSGLPDASQTANRHISDFGQEWREKNSSGSRLTISRRLFCRTMDRLRSRKLLRLKIIGKPLSIIEEESRLGAAAVTPASSDLQL